MNRGACVAAGQLPQKWKRWAGILMHGRGEVFAVIDRTPIWHGINGSESFKFRFQGLWCLLLST